MKIKKQDLRENIEQLIGDGVINGEEIDITTEKVLTLTYTIIDYLEAKIKDGVTMQVEVLKRYEQWEANMVLDPRCWENEYPELTEELYDELLEIQKLRNEALLLISLI